MTDIPRSAARVVRRVWGTVAHDAGEIWANRAAARQIGRFAVAMGLRRVADARRAGAGATKSPGAAAQPASTGASSNAARTSPAAPQPARGDAPWPDYATLTGAQIVERMATADTALVRAVLVHESGGRRRQSVIAAAERRIDGSGGATS